MRYHRTGIQTRQPYLLLEFLMYILTLMWISETFKWNQSFTTASGKFYFSLFYKHTVCGKFTGADQELNPGPLVICISALPSELSGWTASWAMQLFHMWGCHSLSPVASRALNANPKISECLFMRRSVWVLNFSTYTYNVCFLFIYNFRFLFFRLCFKK